MKINGLVVCVNYADFLAVGLDRWLYGLDSLTVVTDKSDRATADLVQSRAGKTPCQVLLAQTDLFYADGARFNKGRAMEWARKRVMPWRDWALFFDSDVVPMVGWFEAVRAHGPVIGRLHSCWRHQCDDPKLVDDESMPRITGDAIGVGYFQLFHTADPHLAGPLPMIDTQWTHAGNYDNRFMDRWPRQGRIALPTRLAHIGPRDNWWGRGEKKAFDDMQAERKRRGGKWDHEVIPGPPPVD